MKSIRDNPKKAFLINSCTNVRIQLSPQTFGQKLISKGNAMYSSGQEEVVPLKSSDPALCFGGHQGENVPSIRQRWVCT